MTDLVETTDDGLELYITNAIGSRMRRCVAVSRSTGAQCKNPAMRGTTVCNVPAHGGRLPSVRRKALVRATLMDWGITDEHVDPGETLLRLVSQSARRASFYGELLRQAYQAADANGLDDPFSLPPGVAALIGEKRSISGDGKSYVTEEAVRGLAALEMAERKICADFSSKAIAAGLAERTVRVAEQLGDAVTGALMAALDRAGVVGPARLEAQNAAADFLLELQPDGVYSAP